MKTQSADFSAPTTLSALLEYGLAQAAGAKDDPAFQREFLTLVGNHPSRLRLGHKAAAHLEQLAASDDAGVRAAAVHAMTSISTQGNRPAAVFVAVESLTSIFMTTLYPETRAQAQAGMGVVIRAYPDGRSEAFKRAYQTDELAIPFSGAVTRRAVLDYMAGIIAPPKSQQTEGLAF